MKRPAILLAVLALMSISVAAHPQVVTSACTPNTSDPAVDNFDFDILASKAHPRMYMDDALLKEIKAEIKAGSNPNVSGIHKQIMSVADEALSHAAPIKYEVIPDGKVSKVNPQQVQRDIIACSYAYRMTGKAKYLKVAKQAMLDYSSFPEWDKSFLLKSAICFGLGFGYDWLYDRLDRKSRKAIEEAIYRLGFCERKKGGNGWWYGSKINWNQVCNGGLVCAALAIYKGGDGEIDRECISVIKDAVYSNKPAVEGIYSPSGIYEEGPNYWRYGTGYQTFLNEALSTALGTDFGLSDNEYFSKTGWYKAFSKGNTGLGFNYADCKEVVGASQALWYFAARFNQPELLFDEIKYARSEDAYTQDKCIVMLLTAAHKVGNVSVQRPSKRLFAGGGNAPLVMARTGWDKDDIYLGLKGGSGKTSHGHMDVGEFIYESQGERWGIDLNHTDYSVLQKYLHPMGENLFSKKQDALRFQMIEYGNRFHNTLTINDKEHNVAGYASLGETVDEPGRLGGTMVFNDTFFDDIEYGSRTALIRDGSYLEVTDSIRTKEDAPAHVRWTFVTRAVPQVVDGCIVLTQNGKTLTIRVDGCNPEFRIWSTNPRDYEGPTRSFEKWHKDVYACGYEYDIPAGCVSAVVTTLKN